MVNRTKVDEVLGLITAENLDMGDWAFSKENPALSCGTTLCMAGHAAVASGAELDWQPKMAYVWNDDLDDDEYMQVGWTADNTTDGRSIFGVGQEYMDLTYEQADAIFYYDGIGNDVELLKEHVGNVLDGDYLETYF